MKKTFKLLLSAAILFSATLSANAQLLKKEKFSVPDPMHFGVRGGITFNSFTDYDPYLFPTGGLAVDYQMSATTPIFIGAGLNYVNYVVADEREYMYGGHKLDEYCGGIQIPVTLSYHINVAPHLFINPFAGVFTAFYPDSYFEESLNYGLRIGLGMNFKRITLDFCYDAGLAKHNLGNHGMTYEDVASQKSNTLFLTVGFNFIGKR